MRLLTFDLDGTRCGVQVDDVVEVVRAVAVTTLVGAPPVVEGVIDFRGAVAPVFDLRRCLRRPPASPRLSDHFVVVLAGTRLAALRVDRADATVDVDPDLVEHPQEHTRAHDAVAGVARLADGLVVIHDVRRFLTTAERATLDTALDSALDASRDASRDAARDAAMRSASDASVGATSDVARPETGA